MGLRRTPEWGPAATEGPGVRLRRFRIWPLGLGQQQRQPARPCWKPPVPAGEEPDAQCIGVAMET